MHEHVVPGSVDVVACGSRSAFTVDVTQWPLVMVVYPVVATMESVELYLARVEQIYRDAMLKHVHTASVADMSSVRISAVPANVRSCLLAGLQAIDAKYFGVAVCDAVVSPSPMLRALVTAAAAVRTKRNHVTRAFSDHKDAVNWARLTLNAAKRH